MTLDEYLQQTAASRAQRMAWWHAARFGMFIHWGLYSQLGRHEWVMNRERIPIPEYEKLAATWKPGPAPAREWARLAKQAGMKYMVMTTKHHEGFCLWDTQQTPYNAMRLGPQRDLVAEFVAACREFGLKVGFYYSLMDWHHPDGALCATDEAARRRFLDFTQGCVRELCSNYGQLDVLWYDVSWPLETAERWESLEMNQMVRRLQPGIIVNNRAFLREDYGTPEEHVTAEEAGRAWEACMTFNGSWGYMPISPDWRSVREVVGLLNAATSNDGNLLLNIGPAPDGSVPPEAVERLSAVGRWLEINQEAVYGQVDRTEGRLESMPTGLWSAKGNTAYFWVTRWPGSELVIGGLQVKVLRASLLAGALRVPLSVEQSAQQLKLRGLPSEQPDEIAGTTLIKLECDAPPRQVLGHGYQVVDVDWKVWQ
jgi:alpha-L-fucosidase